MDGSAFVETTIGAAQNRHSGAHQAATAGAELAWPAPDRAGTGDMRFKVDHITRYAYSEPVRLGTHVLRLRPRCAGGVRLLDHWVDIDPRPVRSRLLLDSDGNLVQRVAFDGLTAHLTVGSRFEIETSSAAADDQPRDPAIGGGAYAAQMQRRLAPWIDVDDGRGSGVAAIALEVGATSADAFDFVARLNRHLFGRIEREIRETGAPQSPERTLSLGRGACRDLTVLFCAICRQHGLAARFVSGYQKGRESADGLQRRWMHAWPEVYLPGDGWCGFDPTHGEPVADAHVALAAAARPEDAAPIEGSYFGAARSMMTTELNIDVAH